MRRTRNPRASRSTSPTSPKRSKAIRAPCCSAPSARSAQELVGNVTGSRARIARAVRRRAGRAAAGNPAAAAQQAGDRRGRARRGAGAGGRADRRRCRSDRAAGPSAARRRRRALYLGLDRLRRRSEDRLDQCRHPPPDAARAQGGRRRPQLAERPARDLRSERGHRQAGADRFRGRLASDRPPGRRDAAADRRPRPDLARCATRRCRW